MKHNIKPWLMALSFLSGAVFSCQMTPLPVAAQESQRFVQWKWSAGTFERSWTILEDRQENIICYSSNAGNSPALSCVHKEAR